MTQEDKELLLKDLCARLPYFVQVNINGEIQTLNSWADDDGNCFNFLSNESDGNYGEGFTLDEIKPYLRPMSSMTDEERNRENWLKEYGSPDDYVDFCLSHHLDYKISNGGLSMIEKGLALEATEGMYGRN